VSVRTTVRFDSAGTACDAWHFPGEGDALATPAGRPVVVMAHGLGGTKDSGLEPFAVTLAAAGLDVLAFDYRGFGASEGDPRQRVSMAGQLEDYRAAMAAAVVSLTPLVDGVAAGRHALASHSPTSILRSTVAGVRSRVGWPST
jgi:pimeloyl-ACP methyl ester carboxylesterase